MKQLNVKKLVLLNLPYLLLGLFATNLGEAWRLAVGADASAKLLSFFSTLPVALGSWWPSLHPLDLAVGLCCGAGLRLAVYLKGKNAKKYRHNVEYGSARWGTHDDIAPYIDPVFQNNVILTQTERLTMSSRPKNPKYARNKNVLVIGGSGSGKTRFWLKPNLMQMHSSYVVTDPKGTILVECGKMLQRGAPKLGKDGKPMKDKNGKVIYEPYQIKVLNTINFAKSMHYNPFAYIHSEKDILKLVTTLIANTKGEGKSGDDFWVKAETLLYCALIGYIHYEAPVEEQNFSTLIEMINSMEVREDDEEFKNAVDLMFDELKERAPHHFAVRQYAKYKLAAGKTAKSILVSCGARLAVFDIAELREVTAYDELELDTLGDRRTALFLIMSDTDDIPDSIRQIAMQGEFNEFDLNVFFSAKGKGAEARFVYENEVQKWLDLIRGAYLETSVDDLKLGAKKPAMPYADVRLLNVLQHTLWFLPNVASCYAMKNLLMQKQNTFYHDYTINVCAGTGAGIGAAALEPVQKSMRDPLESKTITLSCGKLTTGVTVKPWTGIFMLRNLSSPETYFQAAFRVQSPWEITTDGGKKEIVKQECYVFDFALDRALKQISDYSCRLNIDEGNPEKKVAEFINFLPVIAYDGSTMRQIDAGEVLDIAMAGTSATLLAKRWESALLVNVDNDTLSRLMANSAAMDALMKIEGFRSLNEDIKTIINKSEAVKKAKKEGTEKLTPKEKKELSEEEKEYKSKRKQIQEKLIKFATRIPVFMYLTDYRERCLKDVITQLEPGLFKKVTGLDVTDFELLVSLGVFNDSLMNDAVYKFKRYEDASLSYTGINRHEGENRGGWDTVITDADYNSMFALQQASMEAPIPSADDLPEKPFLDFAEAVRDMDQPEKDKQHSPKIAERPAAYGQHLEKPRYTPPAPKPAEPAPQKQVDLSCVVVGGQLRHKAFGVGTVKEIQGGLIVVVFGGTEKKFQFPGALLQGFLSLPE